MSDNPNADKTVVLRKHKPNVRAQRANSQQVVEKPRKKPSRTFAKRIQQVRMSQKMTQKVFATSLGVKMSVVSDWEAGRTAPTGTILNKLKRKYPQLN